MTQVPILDIRNLKVDFATRDGMVHALESVSFQLVRGETMGLVGESGSGKSVSAYAVMRLLGSSAHVTADRMVCGGVDLRSASDAEVASLRGKRMTMIFQNARAALNPIRSIGDQIVDVLRAHRAMPKREAHEAAIMALAEVRIPDPKRRYHAYPFELSGGMCQRVMIALAFASEPELLIADEPTTGLDVTTQAVIMDLIREKSSQRQMSTILITHDLTLAAEYCDRFAVMHAGHIVEQGTTTDIFQRATHPYTGLLMQATPHGATTLSELAAIPGSLPDLRRELPPCRFVHRCPQSTPACAAPLPRVKLDASHEVACHMPWRESE